MCLAAVGARLWLGPFATDDAYITFRYVRNLAAGAGFTYNPPLHVLGTTTPLFTLLMSVPAVWGADPRWTALVISTLSDIGTVACVALILRRHGWTFAPVICAVAIALWFPSLAHSVSGMETSLYVALLAAALVAVDRSQPVTAAGLLGLATLCRPDALLAVAVVSGWLLRRHARHAIKSGALFAAIITPWVIFSLWYFQTVVPSSIVAKSSGRLAVGQSLLVFASQFAHGVYLPLTILAVGGAAVLLLARRDVFIVGAAWATLYAAAFIGSGAFSHFPWYFAPLYPLYLAAISVALEALARQVVPPNFLSGVGLSLGLLTALVLAVRLPHDRDTLREWSQSREFLYERVARVELRGTDCTLAATEIGTLGYFYQGPVLDLIGLVSPKSIGRPFSDIIQTERPCWVATYDDHVDRAVLKAAWFRDQYDLVFSRRVAAAREFLLYRRRARPVVGSIHRADAKAATGRP